MDRLQEYQAAQTLDEPTDSPVLDQEIHQVPTKWSPPCSNIYKANFDGAVFQELQKAGVGVVIRNSNGEVIGALSESYFLPHYKKTGLSQRFEKCWDSPKKRWDRVKIPIPAFFFPALQTAAF